MNYKVMQRPMFRLGGSARKNYQDGTDLSEIEKLIQKRAGLRDKALGSMRTMLPFSVLASQMDDIRTSHQVFLSDKYPVVQDIYDKLSNIIGIDKDHFEQLQVVRYKPGQLYKEHWDACWEKDKCQDFVKRGGNRYATFLLYLNDDFEGGETYFPLRNIKIKPEKVDIILNNLRKK